MEVVWQRLRSFLRVISHSHSGHHSWNLSLLQDKHRHQTSQPLKYRQPQVQSLRIQQVSRISLLLRNPLTLALDHAN